MIFVDSGVWFARFVPDDPNHAPIVEWFSANRQPLIITDYCVDETLTLLIARKRPKLALVAGRELFEEAISRLHFLTNDQIRRAWILFQPRAANCWSFTDCTSKIAIGDNKLQTAVTLDQHFQQFGAQIVP